MSKKINIKKSDMRCPHCEEKIGEEVELEYETVSLDYTRGGQRKITSTHQIIYCNGCGKIISIVPHRVTPFFP